MIIETGLRTDIPAFYSQWLRRRLEEGFVDVRNPFNASQVTRYLLDPEVVDLITFCSKNPGPLLPHLAELAAFGQFWFVTITPYGRDMEPNVPPPLEVAEQLIRLSSQLSPRQVAWRYDPILLNERYDIAYHLRAFQTLAERLRGATDTVVISFLDLYPKLRQRFPEAQAVGWEEQCLLVRELSSLAKDNGMTLKTCAEDSRLAEEGAEVSGCQTLAVLERSLGEPLRTPRTPAKNRGCACHLTCDIGAYNSCLHLCRYCYANHDGALVRSNYATHDEKSSFLLGGPRPGDMVRSARQESWRDREMRLFE